MLGKINHWLAFAHRLADTARQTTTRYFRQPLSITTKTDQSPVTKADRSTEAAMRTLIERHYPTHGIIGEEFGRIQDNADCIWVLDPIDGTRSFISGSPLYTTLIALLFEGKPIIGILDLPMLNERWVGIDSPPDKCDSHHNDNPCKTVSAPTLSDAILTTTTLGLADNAVDNQLRHLNHSVGQTRLGGDSFCYGCLASGFSHLAADYLMQTYDYMALIPIVKSAGGVITNWQDEPLTLASGEQTVLASATPSLHHQALAVLSERSSSS